MSRDGNRSKDGELHCPMQVTLKACVSWNTKTSAMIIPKNFPSFSYTLLAWYVVALIAIEERKPNGRDNRLNYKNGETNSDSKGYGYF